MPTMTKRRQQFGAQKSDSVSISAPVLGWNARDALAAMHPHDAVRLENFWPGTSSVLLRKGYTPYMDSVGHEIETLMTYTSGTSNQFFAAGGTAIYDISTSGFPAASLASLTNARWQYANFTVAATASYLLMVNGEDKMRIYDGTDWHADGDGAPYTVTNVDTADCINIEVFKNRIWLIQVGTLKAWYLPINAIGGAATALDMSSLCKKGGYLMAAMTWTLDAGYGMDDYLTFITSEGEVLVWRLTDPTSPTGIALIGVYQIGAPIGRRCWVKYGGDLLLITRDGVVPMSSIFQSETVRVSITDKIQRAMSEAIADSGANFGWQLIVFPGANQLYLNVPFTTTSAISSTPQQFVQNNITRAWCKFTGWDANCWGLFNNELYFGGTGVVSKAWDGLDDNGSAIQGFGLQAFRAWGGARQKQCKMVRFHLLAAGSPTIFGNVNVDFDTADRSAQLQSSSPGVGLWDSGLWDTAIWGTGLEHSGEWQGATGIGYTFAPLLKSAANDILLEWAATDLVFEAGGTL